MNLVLSELYKVRQMPLVSKAYCTSDLKSIAVELVINPSIGLPKQNLLFFPVTTFLADQVNTAIVKVIAGSVKQLACEV